MDARRLRSLRISAAILLAVIASSVLIPGFRRPILRAAGWALVYADRIEPADVIVVAVDAYGAGVIEAADLVHDGIATRVGLFSDDLNAADRELARRGVPYESNAERSDRQLRALGVATVEHIPGVVVGTESAGEMLVDWCRQRGYHSVVVVSNTDHSRRLRRVFRRSLNGRDVTVLVKPSRFSNFDPDRWWETRTGVRTEIVELQKLLLDVVRHPVS
jgi:ABC-type branched-subunit amino acid transport system substrate-binding protein